jgi:hypothetical protein
MFSLYLLQHYASDPTHVIDLSSLRVSNEGSLTVEPIRIMDHHISKTMTSNSRSSQGPVGKL